MLPVAKREEEVQRRALVGVVVPRPAQQQVTGGVEVVRVQRLGAGPGIGVAIVAEPPEGQCHLRPGRILDRQPVKQRASHRDGLVAVGPGGGDGGRVPLVQARRREGNPVIEQGGEQGAGLGEHLRVAGPVIAAGNTQQHGQCGSCVVDGRVQVRPVEQRAVGDVVHGKSLSTGLPGDGRLRQGAMAAVTWGPRCHGRRSVTDWRGRDWPTAPTRPLVVPRPSVSGSRKMYGRYLA